MYTFDWDERRSTLEFGVGDVLEDRYDFEYNERITLEVRGDPHWRGDDSRLELIFDEHADQLRVQHPVRIQSDDVQKQRQAAFSHTLVPENTTKSAAIDVGANNTLAIVTEAGDSAVCHARPEFDRSQTQSKRIAELQSELPDGQWTSSRIKRIYDHRSRKRDHSRDAAVKHAAEWVLERNVDTVYIGDLTDVLETHWSSEVNENTSSECPACGSETVTREGDSFRCHECALEAHSDIAGAWNILQSEVGPMARPAALSAERGRDAPAKGAYWQWNDHDWIPGRVGKQLRSVDQPRISKPASLQPK